jgi:hypothetical protein
MECVSQESVKKESVLTWLLGRAHAKTTFAIMNKKYETIINHCLKIKFAY